VASATDTNVGGDRFGVSGGHRLSAGWPSADFRRRRLKRKRNAESLSEAIKCIFSVFKNFTNYQFLLNSFRFLFTLPKASSTPFG